MATLRSSVTTTLFGDLLTVGDHDGDFMEDFDKNPRWYQRPILALFCDRIWAKQIRCFVLFKSQHRQRWKRYKRSNDIIQHGRGDLIVNCPLYKAHPPPAHPHSWDNLSTSPSTPHPPHLHPLLEPQSTSPRHMWLRWEVVSSCWLPPLVRNCD